MGLVQSVAQLCWTPLCTESLKIAQDRAAICSETCRAGGCLHRVHYFLHVVP